MASRARGGYQPLATDVDGETSWDSGTGGPAPCSAQLAQQGRHRRCRSLAWLPQQAGAAGPRASSSCSPPAGPTAVGTACWAAPPAGAPVPAPGQPVEQLAELPQPQHAAARTWPPPSPPLRSRARHQRSASVGLPSSSWGTGAFGGSGSGALGAWWTGPVPPCNALRAAAYPSAAVASGSLLGLGVWGGALGSLVETLGGRRPSFCLDPAAAAALARSATTRVPSRAGSTVAGSLPCCLICLDTLSPEEFDAGSAIAQACACKGDAALRHLRCAVQWSHVKRSTVCDVCRAPIANLPALPELPSDTGCGGGSGGTVATAAAGADTWDPLSLGDPPGLSDYIIDAVRVTWVTLVACIVFADMPVMRAFVVGGVVGAVLTVAAHACAMAQRSAAAVRAFAAALRQRALAAGQHEQQAPPPPAPHGPAAGQPPSTEVASQQERQQQQQLATSLPWHQAVVHVGPGGSSSLSSPHVDEHARRPPAGRAPRHSRAPSHATVLLVAEEAPEQSVD